MSKNPILITETITEQIYLIRGRKVMLDRDLALLYGVPTYRLNEQVKRNNKRFPNDFMFKLNKEEYTVLRSQNAILKRGAHSKYLPHVFTEQGIAMLSGVLNSDRAIEVNIAIMRTFTKMRELLLTHLCRGERPLARGTHSRASSRTPLHYFY